MTFLLAIMAEYASPEFGFGAIVGRRFGAGGLGAGFGLVGRFGCCHESSGAQGSRLTASRLSEDFAADLERFEICEINRTYKRIPGLGQSSEQNE